MNMKNNLVASLDITKHKESGKTKNGVLSWVRNELTNVKYFITPANLIKRLTRSLLRYQDTY